MSTRSRIGIEHKDGSITSIYCHNDGYLEGPHGVGSKLLTYFNDLKKATAILALGDLSSLYENLTPPKGAMHSFDRPLMDITVAYGRDRDEKDTKARVSTDRTEWTKLFEEYNYLFSDGAWSVIREYGEDYEKVYRPLTLALITQRLAA